jgi:hypothetical protein
MVSRSPNHTNNTHTYAARTIATDKDRCDHAIENFSFFRLRSWFHADANSPLCDENHQKFNLIVETCVKLTAGSWGKRRRRLTRGETVEKQWQKTSKHTKLWQSLNKKIISLRPSAMTRETNYNRNTTLNSSAAARKLVERLEFHITNVSIHF